MVPSFQSNGADLRKKKAENGIIICEKVGILQIQNNTLYDEKHLL